MAENPEASTSPTAIVTGASSGVGRATAIQLAEAGYRVALVARSEDKLNETAQACTEAGAPETQVIALDISRADACRAVIEQVMQGWGRVDALANVAGYAPLKPIEQVTPEMWQQNMDINLSAIVHLTAACWKPWRKQKSGVVVNVSSMASIDPFPGFAIYASAKVGVNMFTLCTAREGERIGVKAVAIAPGAIETPMLRENFNEKMIPADQTLSPDQVAEVIVQCITGERDFESGETLAMPSP